MSLDFRDYLARCSKKLLAGVSALALLIGLGGSASASIPKNIDLATDGFAGANSDWNGDPILRLMQAGGGQITPDSLRAHLAEILTPVTKERAESFPDLMGDLRKMSLGLEAEEAALVTLSNMIVQAAADGLLDDETADQLVVDVADQFTGPVQYAKVQNNPGTGKASDRGKEKNNNNGRGNGTYTG